MQLNVGEAGKLEDLSFCPRLRELYETGKTTGRSGKVYQQGGLSTLNNLLTIRRLFEETRPERTLEIGLGCGGSALMFAACHREAGRTGAQQHVAIDPFQELRSDDMGLVNLEQAGLSAYVQTYIEPSQFALPRLLWQGERFGMMYFDGSKLPDDLACDFYFAKRLLQVGGTIIFDDCSQPGVLGLIRSIERHDREHFHRRPRTDYRRVGPVASLTVRAAEILGKVQLVAFKKIAEFQEMPPSA